MPADCAPNPECVALCETASHTEEIAELVKSLADRLKKPEERRRISGMMQAIRLPLGLQELEEE